MASPPAAADPGTDADPLSDEMPEAEMPLKRPDLSDETRAILREEAELEAAARRADSAAAAPPAPLADSPDPAPVQRPDPDELAAAALVAASSRGDLLPDVDEINSTLAATQTTPDLDEDDDHSEDRNRTRRGFQAGFAASVAVAVALVLVYLLAPTIAASRPSLEAPLASYVSYVNGFRLSLDGWLQWASSTLINLTGSGEA